MHYTYNADGEKTMVSEDPVISLGLNAAGTATVTTSGALMATSTGGSVQPYKYNGKELERTAGLDLYDYGARWMDSKIGARFTTIDPMCEEYYDISPYAYCHGNPINRIDPDGKDDYFTLSGLYIGSDNRQTDHIMISLLPFFDHNITPQYSVPIEYCPLKSTAYSNIFTNIVSRDGEMDLSKIHNSRISVTRIEKQDNWFNTYSYNDGPNKINAIVSTIKNSDDDIIITAFVFQDNEHPNEKNIFTTVSNVINVLVGHEYNGHVINNYSDENNNHYVAFEKQMEHNSWEKTTEAFKQYENKIYEQVKKREQ